MRKIILLLLFVVLIAGCGEKQDVASAATGNVAVEYNVDSCVDSDDGIDIGERGFVEGTLDDADYDFEDRCVGNIIVEYYCEGNSYKSQNLRCDNKCEDGACK